MNNHTLLKVQVSRLVAQDPEINQSQMKEFRMQLEQTLELSEAKAQQTRRWILIAWLVYFFSMACCMLNLGSVPMFVVLLTAMTIGGLLLALYLIKDGPRVSRARFDLQAAMMLELQEQVRELQQQIARLED